jgi:hypothetical protein
MIEIQVTNREALMDALRKDLYERDLVALANYVGVSASALYAIRAGRTKWPRHATLLTLIHVLKYELWLRKP